MATGGVGPFITWVIWEDADAGPLLSSSRRHRKGLQPLAVATTDSDPAVAAAGVHKQWHRFWAPRQIGWWIAIFFMIGSLHFAVGGAQATWPDAPAFQWIGNGLIGWIFFVGALFFTAAGYLQWLEAHNNDITDLNLQNPSSPQRWRFFGWCPRNLGYLSALTQLVGTVFFNVNTADALLSGLGWLGQDLLVWAPDILGSICFLAASQLAVMEVSHSNWSFQPRNHSWWIAAINLLGSVFFMISALASFVEPGPVAVAPFLANFGTFAGAVCFFVGAFLLIPELFERDESLVEPEGPGNPH
jgi:hypothetical protein